MTSVLTFLSWESGRCLWNNPPDRQKLDQWPKGRMLFLFFIFQFLSVRTAASTCAMGNVRPPKKEEGIHFLTDLPA